MEIVAGAATPPLWLEIAWGILLAEQTPTASLRAARDRKVIAGTVARPPTLTDTVAKLSPAHGHQ